MPNTPAQFPNFDLPGAEWFSLAPNANLAIQGRRRKTFGQYLAVPANSSAFAQNSYPLETNFIAGSGIYLHHAWMYSADQSGVLTFLPFLALNTSSYGISGIGVPLGFPLGQRMLISERDLLLTQRDFVDQQAPGFNLNLYFDVRAINSTATDIGTTIYGGIVYTRLDGFTE